ncbi:MULTISPECIES: AAA family ATPase [unclassified Tolypothrix]|uniref:AAA family ATPase n=1 Tax=unclassified Tolypothrix TaxID=2649714 RepID=UPI0005EAA450|nr:MULTISPECIES: MoxR family ATPase [unclassified Tolypothrix]BAY95322.1 hypothetical protein NIES3275_73790 [Microchaete diplosiphon NIES-3275]EKE96722.1 ATPase, AAA family [Tolypothrix sp. PCC 7601]MBE9084541.1 MoxR family ATPase [Tolypothrix sp. LEGE 11397]UYD30542.1 MoxR family ATPase [Tolypothrix sp. PCC 7712]UYD38327.1 MoxR family ATPase [Tolypothrix sp. PCC 7601]
MSASKTDPKTVYTGKKQPTEEDVDGNGQRIYPYLPDQPLVEAVNLAIYLKRPLLLKGEPGCGKTQLARAVAYELGSHSNFKTWCINSNSRAKDGLYTYNSIKQLLDTQLAGSSHEKTSKEAIKRLENPYESYVKLKALGEAFNNEERTVVLIDEIDKADIDFPNDLLNVLEEKYFEIEEIGKRIPELSSEKTSPIIFITSNDEKPLPEAFLRRCLFHYIEFPDETRLQEILKKRFNISPQENSIQGIFKQRFNISPKENPKINELVNASIKRFLEIRQFMKNENISKKVSTSELIDWFDVILEWHKKEENYKYILSTIEKEKLPYPSVLFKHWDGDNKFNKLLEVGKAT